MNLVLGILTASLLVRIRSGGPGLRSESGQMWSISGETREILQTTTACIGWGLVDVLCKMPNPPLSQIALKTTTILVGLVWLT
jgi:hypothetical protein